MANPVTSGGTTTGSSEFATAIADMQAKAAESLQFQQQMADLNQNTQAEESAMQYQVARDNAVAQLIETISRG